ncbi:helix-turn-helix transcriptional regulator [Paenibacillus arenosi]|uniref:Helix-turn-helix transcriptional regulator n=1 Tax=Paenibacillus arenosi TaxID=2774142 RepID=A0ABR9AYX9_9BACL|nr:AraC family transcriptional regulator [Paenibacillus arenosi]MBD8499360.1 helix-turn-helix transcriptional regulator [Paenibacillus arenosi]
MKNEKIEMFEAHLLHYGFQRDECDTRFNLEGARYSLSSEKGEGDFWLYTYDNLFAITVQDCIVYEDMYMEFAQPEYLCVSCYDSVSGEELNPTRRLNCSCIKGHVGNNDLYQVVYHKNIPIRCTAIYIMPEYYKTYLQARFPGEYEDPRDAFVSIDGAVHFPELMNLLGQIKTCNLTGIWAKLFYESKVAEALSLIVHRTHTNQQAVNGSSVCVCKHDLKHLANVMEYINDHFALDIQLDSLAKLSCMSATKLKYTFKKVYKCTIFEYIHSKRMSHAQKLLQHTEYSIQHISQAVGYKKASNFSTAFRKSSGLLPSEYRLRSNSSNET